MQYIKIEPPKKKSDWQGKLLILNEAPPRWVHHAKIWLPAAGTVARITRRLNAQETQFTACDCSSLGNIRVLKLHCNCPHCDHPYVCFIPESWIAEGKAHFVEACDDQN